MRAKRARYQQGSIRKIPRANGFAWEVRFSETIKGKRSRKTLIFSADEYPKEKDVRTAIQSQVALANSGNDRVKLGATYGTIGKLYWSNHLPGLRHSAQSTNSYLLKNYIEPRWADEYLQDVTPLKALNGLGELGELARTT